jgi:hypothetical protein
MKIFVSVLATLALILTAAQTVRAAESDLQQWTIITATGKLSDTSPWRYFVETQPRIGDDIQHIERLMLRGALGFELRPGLTLWTGYAWAPLFLDGNMEPKFIDEHRLWQQLLYDQPLDTLKLQHRLRLEQRFIDGVTEVSHRVRYLVRASNELGQIGAAAYGLTAYNELFVNVNTTNGPVQGFDRDRFFLGAYITSGNTRYEAGYIGELGVRRNNDERFVHSIALAMSFAF